MKRKLLIFGDGQYGRVVMEIAQAMACYERISFLDDNSSDAIGKIADYKQFAVEYSDAIVAMGHPDLRLRLLNELTGIFTLPVLIHPQATVMPSAQVGKGCVIEPQAVIHSHVIVGDGCLISAGAIVNHNAIIGNGCHIDCQSAVPARSLVPDKTKLPIGTVFSG